MQFKYQNYYLRLCVVVCLVIVLVFAEDLIWDKLKINGNNVLFILISIIIMLFVVNLIFKYLVVFVTRTGKVINNEDGSIEIILSNKKYKLYEITEAFFYIFHLYGVSIGEIYIEYKDEKKNKKSLKIFSEDLHNKNFKETSLFEVMKAKISIMKELKS